MRAVVLQIFGYIQTYRKTESFILYYRCNNSFKKPLKISLFFNISVAKSNVVPKGVPIGFEIAEKNANKHTNKQTIIFVFVEIVIYSNK